MYLVPGVRINIFSITKLRVAGWSMDSDKDQIRFGSNSFLMSSSGLPKVRLPIVQAHVVPPLGSTFADRQVDSPIYLEHCRLGHSSRQTIIDLAKSGNLLYDVDTLKSDDFKLSDCSACLAANSKKLPKTGESPRGSAEGEIVHVDLTGRVNPSVDGHEYALVVYADFTKVRQAIPIKLKSEAANLVQSFIAKLETQSGIKVKVIRSDLGSEFSIKGFCDRTYILHQTTPGYAPDLNGVAERAVGILKTKAAVMVLSSPLGHSYWSYAMKYAAVILNKITASEIEGKTAWEVITGRKTNLNAVREFGEVCFAHVPPELRTRSSFESPKALQARIVGIEETVTGYVVRYEDNGAIGLSRDIRSATGLPLDSPIRHIISPPARTTIPRPSPIPLS